MPIFTRKSLGGEPSVKNNRGQKIESSELELLKLEKDFFIAEYNSLRQEILQRVAQLTLFSQIALTAFAALAGIALKDTNYTQIILLYPILSLFLSFSYGFNNSRIFEIARYLQCREREIERIGLGSMYWECYINNDFSGRTHKGRRRSRIRPGVSIFMGTQAASLLLWLFALARPDQSAIDKETGEFILTALESLSLRGNEEWWMISALLIADLVSMVLTYNNIARVDRRMYRREMHRLTKDLIAIRKRRQRYINELYGKG